jgi:hypothetical protein
MLWVMVLLSGMVFGFVVHVSAGLVKAVDNFGDVNSTAMFKGIE